MKFRKKPVVIDAVQWNGSIEDVIKELGENALSALKLDLDGWLIISTLDGDMLCCIGDWIVKDAHGELYSCDPEIFEKTYERVVDNS